MTTIHVCKEVDLIDFCDFQELMDELDINVVLLDSDTAGLPCYMGILQNSQFVEASQIPLVLDAACHFVAGDESLIIVSVNSREDNYKDWLDMAENTPGAHVTTIQRDGRTVYNLLFRGQPIFEEDIAECK